jgi:hypothetical protein
VSRHTKYINSLLSHGESGPCVSTESWLQFLRDNFDQELINALFIKDSRIDHSVDGYPLMIANYLGFSVLKKFLRFPDVNPSARDNTILRNAVKMGEKNIVELLLSDHRFQLDEFTNCEILCEACTKKDPSIAKILLNHPKINPTTFDIFSAAILGGNTTIFKLLIKDVRTKNLFTQIHASMLMGFLPEQIGLMFQIYPNYMQEIYVLKALIIHRRIDEFKQIEIKDIHVEELCEVSCTWQRPEFLEYITSKYTLSAILKKKLREIVEVCRSWEVFKYLHLL